MSNFAIEDLGQVVKVTIKHGNTAEFSFYITKHEFIQAAQGVVMQNKREFSQPVEAKVEQVDLFQSLSYDEQVDFLIKNALKQAHDAVRGS